MKKLKIGIVIFSIGIAGAENAVFNIIKNMSKHAEIHLFINGEVSSLFNKLKVKTHDLGYFYNIPRIKRIKKLLNIGSILCRESIKLDVINLHLPASFIAFYRIFNKNNLPIITTLHGTEIKKFNGRSMKPFDILDNILLKKAMDNSIKITSVSNHQIQNLNEKYKQKTVVIPNGVDSKLFRPIPSITTKKNVVLFAGRFIDIKGVRELVAVAKQLPQYEFWFAGQGPFENIVQGNNIKNLGFKSSEQLAKLYNEATICTFPSYREGFPLIGLEAMACGKPVIATPLGFSEYIENGKDGIIIPAKDENALKNAIVKLMENPKLRKKLGKEARKKAEQYSWDKVAKQYYELFKKVIAENKKTTSS